MAWMILLAKESQIGTGCKSCRFRNEDKCIVDERVEICRDGEIEHYRPYCCPFRYWSTKYDPICKCFNNMTEEETKGWFRGADWVAKHYTELEKERDSYTDYRQKRKNGSFEVDA